ncbi:hypothetical protein [Colwellia sp. Bg11-12]|uniref:hypothetical protein n=1 Tax=Colwellia sp. Bg11-12 TaxID=2759817 RepID=UPI0015F6E67C|nr:hypothetical protein [Colwellia sp. Bg11-12]MBA6263848.1 hypothetical protein [Colwellia sp. Bg11-12]
MHKYIYLTVFFFLSGCCAYPKPDGSGGNCKHFLGSMPIKSDNVKCLDKVGTAKQKCVQQVNAIKKSIENQHNKPFKQDK